MTKTNRQPTEKQATAMQLIRDGEKPSIAMRKAGYSEDTSQAPSRNLLRSAGAKTMIEQQREAYARVGITPQYLADKTKEWLEAVKIKSSMTEPDKTVPDYETQLKAAEMVRSDWDLDKPTVQINQQTNVMPASELAKKIRERKSAE